MKVIFLGTSGAIPTLSRNLPSVAIQRDGEILLFDCGEYTQIQLIKANLRIGRIENIFISHLHGDHVTGLPGILMLLNHAARERPINIYGPPGIKQYIFTTKKILNFFAGYEINVKEISEKTILAEVKGEDYSVKFFLLEHTTFTLGFVFEENDKPGILDVEKTRALGVPEGPLLKRLKNGEDIKLEDGKIVYSKDVVGESIKGRKIVYAVDTRPAKSVAEISAGADLLIHDGMFAEELADEANLRGHSTVMQASEIGKNAEVKKLALTHISPRYADPRLLIEEAKSVFQNSYIAYDLMEIEIPYKKGFEGSRVQGLK
ncbi:MAG: ribonuclease Z [Candidatus Schekmanbacteria bacterium RIFCSPHIGHO2_02_FULL_38_11]|uniref:Ribonuclease Z n=1 Tax=Candidatus Schekmanbacteria bacterium RIFCSPLOWO2_12_FULL_38_15 TaxID=1817883 RepID=A0A1F7SM98_9BACT|nr:MAG: ribonuclease Z [Candidatus Schekmanbacteria bacterium GWA2_38_9]OGL48679.1 MAG: ribonuclease Z [Candidatus Schekmanbacteria bacterium RIFCSPLOWO2_02_FULL_38_14]OGL49182.1 MAG: ribonuclease Z [Candidatus Schekmanbacteria bacterium RIFCSPHIGHO2_02_FULL_38_11]OGL54334.1 MAG: ribonuclease Z [Candidatus Schekmanbacteria bacterium RIFCSPLOWO2_12_FULL_38_15]